LADNRIEIIYNPPDLLQRMRRYPKKLDSELEEAMDKSLAEVWAKVPQYPPEPPGSSYVRTLTLGRSLGTGGTGGATSGSPDIKDVKRIGEGNYEGRFGTRLYYAQYVIGSQTQAKHMTQIRRIFDKMAEKLVDFLGG